MIGQKTNQFYQEVNHYFNYIKGENMKVRDCLKKDIIILGVLFSGLIFLSIFIFILHYNPDPILLLCTFALFLWWIYLVVSYQREIEEKY